LNWKEKLEAAVNAGCQRLDGALKGIGGCPMAQDDLVGNMNTELMISYLEERNLLAGLNKQALERSMNLAAQIFV
jgi:hydroxymethylglutaryl-CoA lyase